MNDITCLLDALEPGDQAAAAQLLPLVYDDLRRLAARHLAHEAPGLLEVCSESRCHKDSAPSRYRLRQAWLVARWRSLKTAPHVYCNPAPARTTTGWRGWLHVYCNPLQNRYPRGGLRASS
jgi:hypothetical protein